MITVDNRSKYRKANHKEHRRLAMLFFCPETNGWAIHTDKEKKTKKGGKDMLQFPYRNLLKPYEYNQTAFLRDLTKRIDAHE